MSIRALGIPKGAGQGSGYHHIEYPAIYHKDRLVGHICVARPGETSAETQARGDREFMELQQPPFFRIWACAAVDEILSALHERFARVAEAAEIATSGAVPQSSLRAPRSAPPRSSASEPPPRSCGGFRWRSP